ncbi:MAG: hypothetical protein GY874_19935 [Desulfobacteraceae bacterium]|nr:hypothetical protein [Desulfobacteraceae bacterium]
MTTIIPEGEDLRKAVRWISQERQDNPGVTGSELIQKACFKFNLSPKDAIFLERYFRDEHNT